MDYDKVVGYAVKAIVVGLASLAVKLSWNQGRELERRPSKKEVDALIDKKIAQAKEITNLKLDNMQDDIHETKVDMKEIKRDIKEYLAKK